MDGDLECSPGSKGVSSPPLPFTHLLPPLLISVGLVEADQTVQRRFWFYIAFVQR
jgi:hypothetical protein